MSYAGLARLGATVRPLSGPRPPRGYRRSAFSASFTATVALLERELRLLDGERVVLGLDLRESQIRVDGLPRADTRALDPTVVLSFESRHGPLRYATAEYEDWRDNVRAIALSMEALRAVDRHGVSKRGEQYVGWRAIPQSTDSADAIHTAAAATAYLAEKWGGDLRLALFETHPDRGGDPDEFRRVVRAKELLA